MTAQMREILHYNGTVHYMRDFPLSKEKLEAAHLRPNGCISSGCWRGYVGQWEIKDGSLYLTSMDLKGFEPMPFSEIFKEATEDGLKADWFDGTLTCDSGRVLHQDTFSTVFERTTTFMIKSGDVVSEDVTQNE